MAAGWRVGFIAAFLDHISFLESRCIIVKRSLSLSHMIIGLSITKERFFFSKQLPFRGRKIFLGEGKEVFGRKRREELREEREGTEGRKEREGEREKNPGKKFLYMMSGCCIIWVQLHSSCVQIRMTLLFFSCALDLKDVPTFFTQMFFRDGYF